MHSKSNKEKSIISNQPHILTNLLVLYFDCCYILFCSPYRFVRNKDGLFKTAKFLPHMLLAAVLNLLAVINIFTSLRISFTHNSVQGTAGPLKYFNLLNELFSNAFQVLTLKNFWFQSNYILNIINYIQSECYLILPVNNRQKIRYKILIYLACLIFAGMALSSLVRKTHLVAPGSVDKTIWIRKLVAEARFMFFLTNTTEQSVLPEPDQITGMDYVLAFAKGLALIQCDISAYYSDLFLLTGVLTTWILAQYFAKMLVCEMEKPQFTTTLFAIKIPPTANRSYKQGSNAIRKKAWSEIYNIYGNIKELCHLVNRAFGSMVTVYLAAYLMFQATSIDHILLTPSFEIKVQLLFFIIITSTIFWLSADVCNKLETLMVWLSKDGNSCDIPLDQTIVIFGELGLRQIGIRGSNIFTITYPLLWNITTTIITYFIICMQSRQDEVKK